MRKRLFFSRCFTYFVVFAFVFLIISEVFSDVGYIGQDKSRKLLKEGMDYYEKGEYERAIIIILEAEKLISNRDEQIEFYFYLSLAYYALGQKDKVKEHLQKLISMQSDYSIDNRYYPSGFVELFNQIQREAFHFITDKDTVEVSEGRKANLRVKLSSKPTSDVITTVRRTSGDSDISVQSGYQLVFTPDNWDAYQTVILEAEVDQNSDNDQATIRITAQGISDKDIIIVEQDMLTTKNGKRKRKSTLFIVAGVAAAGGVVVALLLGKKEKGPTTGSIQLTSNPTGARVYLDDSDTGQLTNCTLPNISPGSHVVKLVREGYVDTERNVSVTAGQTETVNMILSAHAITITNPKTGTIWRKGIEVEITWETNGNLKFGNSSIKTIANIRTEGNILSQIHKFRSRLFSSLSDDKNIQIKNMQRKRFATDDKTSLYKPLDYFRHIKKNSSEQKRKDAINEKSRDSKYTSSKRTNKHSSSFSKLSTSVIPRSQSVVNPTTDMKVQVLSNVSIALYRETVQIQTIASSTLNDGSFRWTVPGMIGEGSNYRVKVSCVGEPDIYDYSEEFEILGPYGEILIDSDPNGASIFVDNVDTGKKTPSKLNISLGFHSLKLLKERYQGFESRIEIKEGINSPLRALLKPGGFEEKFDTEQNVKDYFKESHPQKWKVENGVYKFISTDSSNVRSASHYTLGDFSDFSFEAICRKETQDVWFGLGFRGNEDFTTYHFFYVGTEGKYWILKYEDGKHTTLVDQTPHSAIRTGNYQWNKLKVVANGNLFIFYVNNIEVTRQTIQGIPYQGRIGLVTRTSYKHVEFDDLLVEIIK